jgi:hypothetical protein
MARCEASVKGDAMGRSIGHFGRIKERKIGKRKIIHTAYIQSPHGSPYCAVWLAAAKVSAEQTAPVFRYRHAANREAEYFSKRRYPPTIRPE